MPANFEWSSNWDLEIKTDDGKVVIFRDDVESLYADIRNGFCAICLSEIPQEAELCCDCLKNVYQYHYGHHNCMYHP